MGVLLAVADLGVGLNTIRKMMTPLYHLGVIDELARNSAAYSEFRVHLIAVQESLERLAALEPEYAMFKDSTAKEISDLKAKNKELIFQKEEAKSTVRQFEAEREAKRRP